MSLAKDLEALEPERVERLRRQRDAATAEVGRLLRKLDEVTAERDLLLASSAVRLDPPHWLSPRKKAGNRAIPVHLMSDWHFEEVVNPDEMNGVNAYDRDIALIRFKRDITKVIAACRDYLSGVTYEGFVLLCGGDMMNGDIHPEYERTNNNPTLKSLTFWADQIAAGISQLVDEFGRVHVAWTFGNHGRYGDKKTPSKKQASRNIEPLLGEIVAREFRGDERVTFDIPDSPEIITKVYDTRILLKHGHQGFRGGNGIAGIWSPLSRGHLRLRNVHQATAQPFDLLNIGHFHTETRGNGWYLNGSGKGYDEWTRDMAFDFEVPKQILYLVTPEHGPTTYQPIFVQDLKKEKW